MIYDKNCFFEQQRQREDVKDKFLKETEREKGGICIEHVVPVFVRIFDSTPFHNYFCLKVKQTCGIAWCSFYIEHCRTFRSRS